MNIPKKQLKKKRDRGGPKIKTLHPRPQDREILSQSPDRKSSPTRSADKKSSPRRHLGKKLSPTQKTSPIQPSGRKSLSRKKSPSKKHKSPRTPPSSPVRENSPDHSKTSLDNISISGNSEENLMKSGRTQRSKESYNEYVKKTKDGTCKNPDICMEHMKKFFDKQMIQKPVIS